MDHDKDTRTDYTGDSSDRRRTDDRFFKKFVPRPPAETEASSEALFQETKSDEADGSEPAVDLETTGEAAPVVSSEDVASPPPAQLVRRSPALVWAGLVCITLASLILTLWQTVSHEKARHELQSDASTSSEVKPDTPDKESAATDPDLAMPSPPESPRVSTSRRTGKGPLSRVGPSSSQPFPLDRMYRRTRELEGRGMLEQAAREYRFILSRYPNNRAIQSSLARVQTIMSEQRRNDLSRISREEGLKEFRFGNYAKAEAPLVAAVNSGRVDTATLYALGMTQVKLGNYSNAQIALNRCIATSPNYAPALVGLAQAHIALGEKNRALPLLNRALELGGGAEFTPEKIKEMISSIAPSKAAARLERASRFFFAFAVHRHSLPLLWCRGELMISDAKIHFKANNPAHSFQVSSSEIGGIQASGNTVRFSVSGRPYTLIIEGNSVRDFISALSHRRGEAQLSAGNKD